MNGLRCPGSGARLRERLELCSDYEIGDLLSAVQDVFGIFSAEFAVCEHARRRLQLRQSCERNEKIDVNKSSSPLLHYVHSRTSNEEWSIFGVKASRWQQFAALVSPRDARFVGNRILVSTSLSMMKGWSHKEKS